MYTDDQFQKDNEQLQKRRDYNRALLKDLASRANDMWLVVCVWESPVDGSFEHRQGWFLDFVEADKFCNMLEETYKKLPGLHHHTYCFHTDEDIVRMVCDKLVNTYIS